MPAAAKSCLDHSHSADGAGSGDKARSEARRNWTYSVKVDDGARWANIAHARGTKMTCRITDPASDRTVCTLKATPCADR